MDGDLDGDSAKQENRPKRTKLTDKDCRRAQPEPIPVRHWCSSVEGFHLVVYPTGLKSFALRYTVPGTDKRVSPVLGQYPELSLIDAREIAFQWRLLIRQGTAQDNPTKALRRRLRSLDARRDASLLMSSFRSMMSSI